MGKSKAATLFSWATALTVAVALLAGCSFTVVGDAGSSRATLGISMKQPAAAVVSAALVVTGPDMAPITRALTLGDSQVTVDVPAGKGRTFRVLINTASVTFMGESTLDLVAGEAAEITLHPELYATQIIIPDASNGRIVQIADMSGAGWVDVYDEDIGYTDPYYAPYDIDFDSQGRIYIANNPAEPGGSMVLRLDDINDTTYEEIVSDAEVGGVTAIAIDRTRDYLYYTTQWNNEIYRKKLGPSLGLQEVLPLGAEVQSTYGLAVDPEGFIYVTMTQGAYPGNAVLKVDWNDPGSWLLYGDNVEDPNPLNDPWDVIVKPPYVYVANANTAADWPQSNSLVQLTQDLAFVHGYGTPWGGEGETLVGEFHGPKRFLSPLNAGFFLADEYDSNTDRIVFFSDMSGLGWKTYGSQGPGRNQFSLFVGVF